VTPREFVAEVKVRFADVDHARIVYYPRFFHYFHIAFEELFEREMGMKYPEVIDGDHVGFPAVKTEAEYRSPVRFGDVLRIRVTCSRLGSRSVTLHYRAERVKDGVLCTEARVTTACVDMRTFTSQVIPEKYRELFARFSEA
jgi:4-hydroxybenzoyl-CoA thioesterase